MKKLLFAALLIVSVSSSAVAQNVGQVDAKAVGNFEATYAGASSVQWSTTDNFTKASFMQNDKKVEVFYNADGEFVAATTQIKLEDLPASIKRNLEKKYSAYTVVEAFQYKSYSETIYFVSVENLKESIVLKSTGGALGAYSSKDLN